MPHRIVSPPHCFSCGVGVDEVRLFTCSLVRSYTDRSGVKRHRTTPIRVCRPCAETAITAVARIRASGIENNAGRHSRPHPTRPLGRLGTAERAAEGSPPAIVRLDGLERDQALRVCQLVADFRAENRALPEPSSARSNGAYSGSEAVPSIAFAAAGRDR